MEDIKILYVDDELNNLASFKASFRFDYKILLAKSTAEAIDYLIQHPDINIVMCDQRMPDQTGTDFLENIRLRFPKPVRILITGYTDIDPLIDAINRGNIYRFIKKPWNDLDLRSAIEEGYKFFLTNSLLAQKNEELQGAYNLLNEFAYNVTHGLRDPILSVLSLVEIAQHMDNVPEDVREILDMVGHAMVQLDNYVENTRDYHQLKNGTMQLSDVQLGKVLDSVVGIYQSESEQGGIRFTVNIQQSGSFRSNEALLQIIVNNLLSNAFKYQKKNNDDKFVELNVDVSQDTLNISVKDNGIGIPANHIKNIFDPLYRATSVQYGSGLGLYNVKDALVKLNGEIYVDSKLNIGSTFKVIIPSKQL